MIPDVPKKDPQRRDYMKSYRTAKDDHPRSMDPTFPLIPVLCFTSSISILLTISVNIHLRRNIGMVCLFGWLFFSGVVLGIDTIGWANDAANRAQIWWDICGYISVENIGV